MRRRWQNLLGAAGLASSTLGLATAFLYSGWSQLAQLLVSIGLILLAFFLIGARDRLVERLFMRSTKYTANMLFAIFVVMGIVGVVNFLAAQHSWRKDLTASGQFSLSQQTLQVIHHLPEALQITAFFKPEERDQISDLLREYAYQSPKITFEMVDPDRQPTAAREFGITAYNTVVLSYRDRTEKIAEATEQALTNGIIRITREEQKKFYFVSGHGEKQIGADGRGGLQQLCAALREKNYLVEEILLVGQKKIPADCAVLVIAGAQRSLLANETAMIKSYLDAGGALLILLEPPPAPALDELLAGFGIRAEQDIVIDVSGFGSLLGSGPSMPVATDYNPDHLITKHFGNFMTAFPGARSLSIVDSANAALEIRWLVRSSPKSWGESNYKSAKTSFDAAGDNAGPLALAIAVTKRKRRDRAESNEAVPAKVVVFGDSDFASNAYFSFQGNGDLVLSAMSWLADDAELVSIRPRRPEDRRINLTTSRSRLIILFGVCVLPLGVLLMGLAVHRRRK